MSFVPGKWSIVAFWIVFVGLASSAFASVQGVSFFGAFNSYTQSVVEYPQGIVADASGNLYITGTVNLSYIPVDSNGNPVSADEHEIDNCCGNAYGLAIDSANNLYRPDISNANYNGTPCGIAKYTYNSVNNFTKSCIGSGWVHPSSVAVDANFNVYILDASPGTIYKLTPSGSTYTQTILYGPDISLAGTTGMSMDSAGNFYITSGPNTGNSGSAMYAENPTAAVYKLTLSDGSYTRSTLGSGWTSPSATAVDFAGNVWVSDYGANEISVLIPSGFIYTQTPYTSINELRTLVTNKAGQLYGLAAGSGDAVIWTGGSEPHTVATPSVGASSTVPVTVSFTVPTAVTGYSVVTQGSTGQEFTDAGSGSCPAQTYSSGDTCTVNVSFTPQSPGLSTGAVVLYGTDGAILGTDYFYGVGEGPMVAFTPAVISSDVGTGNACNGTLSSCGDTGAATGATLNNPNAVVFDASGNLYIADTADYAVRKVTPGGTITTIAGTGSQCASASGACGDGGAAVNATFTSPAGLALDGAGNLYIVDAGANRIREVAAGTGTITTIAGDGTACPSPAASCGDTGADTSATFNMEGYGGVVVDENANLVIADYGDNRLRSINLNTGIITTVAGTGTPCSTSTATCGDGGQAPGAQLNGPTGVGIDSSGDYFIADSNDNRVRELSALTGVLTTVAGSGAACDSSPCGDGGAATSAQLNFPVTATTDPAGNIYIADSKDNTIRVVSSATGKISTVAGSYTACGTSTAACGDAGAAPSAQLDIPSGLALNASGNIYIAEATNRIREVNITQTVPLSFPVTDPGSTSAAMSVSLTNIGNAVLTFSGSPSFPSGFEQDPGTTCATSLAQDATCTLAIDFAPPVANAYSGNVVLTDNDLNATTAPGTEQTFALSGTATAPPPPADVTSTSLQVSLGAVTASSPVTITATVTDTSNSGSTPTGSVTLTDTVGTTVTQLNGGNPVPLISGVAALSGVTLSGVGQHTITASYLGVTGFQSSSNTGMVTVDSSSPAGTATSSFPVTLTFTTSGTLGSINVLTEGAPNLDFTDAGAGDTCLVGTYYSAGVTCVVNVIFTPKDAGPRYGAVVLENGSGNLLASAYVNGVGTGPQITFANSTHGNFAPNSVSTLGGNFGFSNPYGVAVDASGDVYVADTGNHAVEEIPAGCVLATCVTTLGGGFSFNSPYGVAVDGAGNVFVSDNGKHEVYELLAVGGYTTVNPLGNSTSDNNPKGVAVDGAGNVYVSGSNNAVYEIPAAGGYATANELGGNFLNPGGVAVDGSGNVYVADTNNLQVKEMPAGCASSACVTTLVSSIGYPPGLAVDGAGNVYVASGGLSEFLAVGGYARRNILASGSSGNSAVTVAANGNVFFINGNAVEEFDYADTPSLTYATSTLVGKQDTTDGAQTVTVSNIGNTALTFSSVIYPVDFSESAGASGACSTSAQLAAGTACTLPVNFTPTQAGSPLDESLVLTDNSLSGTSVTQSISLSGTGIPAPVATTAIASPTLTVYQSATAFTPVTGSSGTAPLAYSVSPMLPAGLSLSTNAGAITGTPTMASAATTYTVTVTDGNGATATATFSLAVNRQATITSVSASVSTATPVQSVTLTATVAATIAETLVVPGGTVTFFDGTTQLGTAVTLASGTAQLMVASLPPGATAAITAIYTGDGNFLGGASSNSATVAVARFDFTFTNPGTSAYTAAPGAMATYNFAAAPLYGSYAGPVSFSVTGLPAGATVSFTPSTVAIDGGATPVVMTVQTASAIAQNHNGNSPLGRGIVLALLLLPFAAKRSVREKLKSRMLLLVLLMAGLTATLTGCGSNNGFLLQSPQTYTLTVTATSGTLQHNQTITLIVQ